MYARKRNKRKKEGENEETPFPITSLKYLCKMCILLHAYTCMYMDCCYLFLNEGDVEMKDNVFTIIMNH